MEPSIIETKGAGANAALTTRRRERLFYVGLSVVVATTVFAGFARTYFLRSFSGLPPLMPLLHLHGIVFTSWIVLLLTQTTLVATNRVAVHRRLGMAGAAIAVIMVVVGTTTAIIRAKQGAAPTGVPPLVFLAIPLFDMLVFSILVGAGFKFRRQPDVHKRLMMLATISILAAAIARLPFGILKAGPPAFFGLTDLFVVACIVYDLIARGRPHRATVWGGLIIILSQPLRLMISGTGAWMAFATWLTHWVS